MMTAARDGIPGLIVEAGGIGPGFTPETVADGAERMRNVARLSACCPAPVRRPRRQLALFSNFAWVNATRGGLFRPAVKCGDRIKKGEVVGRYYDVFGELVEEATGLASGHRARHPPGPADAQRRDADPYRPRPEGRLTWPPPRSSAACSSTEPEIRRSRTAWS